MSASYERVMIVMLRPNGVAESESAILWRRRVVDAFLLQKHDESNFR